MSDDELTVALHWLEADLRDDSTAAARDRMAAARTASRIDDAAARLQRIREHLGVETSPPAQTEHPTSSARPCSMTSPSWDDLVARSRDGLIRRGVDPSMVNLDDMLDPEQVTAIERRFTSGFRLEAQLDQYDVATAVVAGLVAVLVDFLVVRIPADMTYLGQHFQQGSPLTKLLKSFDVSNDNTLAKWCKVSFDKVSGVPVDGFYPKSHRLQTPGHDPLLGLVIGTIDIIRGGLTAIDRSGHIKFFSGLAAPVYNPFMALVLELGHLLSDGFTKMGLPPPGWSILQAVPLGSFGAKDRTIGELARFMYLKGYDSRHFLTMSTSVAAAEVVLRGWFWIRRKLDVDYERDVAHQALVASADSTGDHPRFQAMALLAHGIAAGANAGKVAVFAGNPLAVNYAQWLRFAHAFFRWQQIRWRSPSEVLMGHARANLQALYEGWPDLGVKEEGYPVLSE